MKAAVSQAQLVSSPDAVKPEGYFPQARGDQDGPRRQRAIVEAVALDDDGRPVRVAHFHAPCGARLFVGYHDFNGFEWTPRYFESEDPDAELVAKCPVCGGVIWNDRGYGKRATSTMLTGMEMDMLRLAQKERMSKGGAIDGAAVAAMTADLEEGLSFDEAAVLYGRSPEKMRAELEAWLDAPTKGDER